MLTRTFNSGKLPSTFLSHIKMCDEPSSTVSHIRKRPAVSSEFKGMIVMLLIVGGGNVKNSSVDVHVARWSLAYLVLNCSVCCRTFQDSPATLVTICMIISRMADKGLTLSQNSMMTLYGIPGTGATKVEGFTGSYED
jgi:hypothetical protein